MTTTITYPHGVISMKQALQNPQRYRGFVLTAAGLQKLQEQIHKLETSTQLRQNPRTIAERVQLTDIDGIHPMTVRKMLSGQSGVDRRSLDRVFRALQLQLEEGDYAHASLSQDQSQKDNPAREEVNSLTQTCHDLGESGDITDFYGRNGELAQLQKSVVDQRCRLVALLGMGGVGKTTLALKLAHATIQQNEFEFVMWRSLRYAPPIQQVLVNTLQFLTHEQSDRLELPTNIESLMTLLIQKLRQHRCLLIFDHVETVLSAGQYAGYYCEGYQPYGDLLKLAAEVPHQSCLVLTSREQPKTLGILAGKQVRSHYLNGLSLLASQQLLAEYGHFNASLEEWQTLVEYYAGNPLTLKLVATRIQNYFNNSISAYLNELEQSQLMLSDVEDLFAQQLNRVSEQEQEVLRYLAFEQNWVALSQLRQQITSYPSGLLETLDSLRRRCLIETSTPDKKTTPINKHEICFKLHLDIAAYIREYQIQPVSCITVEHSATSTVRDVAA